MLISYWSSDVFASYLLALEDVAFGEADLALDIPGRAHLLVQDEVAEVGAVAGDLGDDGLRQSLARRPIPRLAGGQLVGRVLHEDRHHVLAGRCHGGIRSEEHTSALQSLMRHSYAV